LLQHAMEVSMREKGVGHDHMSYILANAALTFRGLGYFVRAERLMEQAVTTAKANNHVNLAPAMTDLAELKCRRGAREDGLALLRAARNPMRDTYPSDPWRAAWLDNIEGECLLSSDPARGAPLIRRSTSILRQKWQPGTYYRVEADRRATAIRY
jgi:hypothetical protein